MILHTLFLNLPLAWCIKSYLGAIVLGGLVLIASDISLHGFGNEKKVIEQKTDCVECARLTPTGERDQDWW